MVGVLVATQDQILQGQGLQPLLNLVFSATTLSKCQLVPGLQELYYLQLPPAQILLGTKLTLDTKRDQRDIKQVQKVSQPDAPARICTRALASLMHKTCLLVGSAAGKAIKGPCFAPLATTSSQSPSYSCLSFSSAQRGITRHLPRDGGLVTGGGRSHLGMQDISTHIY